LPATIHGFPIEGACDVLKNGQGLEREGNWTEKMVRFFVCCVAILIGSGANAAEHIVGVVEVPALHNNLAGGPSGPVPLFAEPSMQSEVAVVVREWRHLEYRDVNAEAVAAVVYDYKVTSGVGWAQVSIRVAQWSQCG
jgi:hypothetical protein